jgi:hypothetical protein
MKETVGGLNIAVRAPENGTVRALGFAALSQEGTFQQHMPYAPIAQYQSWVIPIADRAVVLVVIVVPNLVARRVWPQHICCGVRLPDHVATGQRR